MIIDENPTTFIRFTKMFNDSSLYSGLVARSVIIIPMIQTNAVFVTFKRDLVNASNNLVIDTPPKLKSDIVIIPRITNTNKNALFPISLKYMKGSSMKA